jgi:hypothetical protein
MEIKVTEQHLKQLRADMRAARPPSNEAVATVVLARAGQATPPGLYTQVRDRWLPVGWTSLESPERVK